MRMRTAGTSRRVARAVVIAAIVLLAAVSAPRLQLDYAPRFAMPELEVSIAVSEGAADPVEMSRRWVLPVESAIRGLGDVRATRAQVSGSNAQVTVLFERDVDADVKAARLSSDLAALRSKMPRGSSVTVWPSIANRPALVLGVRDAVAAQRLSDALRSARGVRDVSIYGGVEPELEVVLRQGTDALKVREALRTALTARYVGRTGERRTSVLFAPAARRVEDVRVGNVRIGSLATTRSRIAEPDTQARVDGKPSVIVTVHRDDDVSLFAFDAAVRDRIRSVAAVEIWSDASELKAMLVRIAIGIALASLLLGLLASWPLALYLPLSIAIAMNVYGLAGVRLDWSVIVLTLIALAAVAPFAVWRRIVPASLVLLLPLAAAFGSGALAPLVVPPAKAFVMAAMSAMAAVLLLGGRDADHAGVARRGSRLLRSALRGAGSVVLATSAATLMLLVYFGNRLDPRGESASDPGRLYVNVRMPAGATLANTVSVVERVEKALATLGGVSRQWSFVDAGYARMTLELEPELRSPGELQRFRIRLRGLLPFSAGVVQISDGAEAGGRRFDVDVEDEPRADPEGSTYRFLVKGTDAEVLRRIADEIAARLSRLGVRRALVQAEWPPASARLELVPRRDMGAEEQQAAAGMLFLRGVPARAERLADGTLVRVVPWGAPARLEDAPQRAELFSRAPQLASRFAMRTAFVPGGMTRELGRFVLPVTVRVPGFDEQAKKEKRVAIDRSIALLPMPPGVVLDRPSLSEWTFSLQKGRMIALASLLPLFLFAAAAILLASLRDALSAVASSAAGVAIVAPVLLLAAADVDEMVLLAMAATVCCTTALAVAVLLTGRDETRALYRGLRSFSRRSLVVAMSLIALLAIAATAPAAARDGWRAPLLAAAAVLAGGVPAAVFAAPAAGLVTRELRRLRSAEARSMRHPGEWRSAGMPLLEVRNVTKHYASGFRALHRVSFELTPGVIGLLGPNGAGKTTLLRILTGLLLPTRGQVSFRGVTVGPQNLAEYRRGIGFLPQEFNAYAGLTAAQFLDYWMLERGIGSAIVRHSEVERLLVQVGLEGDAGRRVRDFSGGMRQRIGIARALIGDPPLLVVDEPTTGLDLESRNRFRDLLASLAGERIIILSTHIAGDVEATASRILLLTRGVLRWDGTPASLIESARGRVFDMVVSEGDARAMSHRYRVTTRIRVAGGVRVRGVVPEGAALPGPASEPTLEEAYLAVAAGERSVGTGGFAFLFEKSA